MLALAESVFIYCRSFLQCLQSQTLPYKEKNTDFTSLSTLYSNFVLLSYDTLFKMAQLSMAVDVTMKNIGTIFRQ